MMRAYVDGVEIDKIPELAEVCKADNWFNGLMKWASENRPDQKMDLVLLGESQELLVGEVWIGGAPPLRAQELGGILKTVEFSKASHPRPQDGKIA